ncbi:MAG: hypothetical protein R3B72_32260 [Polyangiaceae bacterium]
MARGPYRQSLPLADRIARGVARGLKLEARLSERYWQHLEDESRLPVGFRGRSAALGESPPTTEVERALEAHLEELEALVADAPRQTERLAERAEVLPRDALGEPWPAAEVLLRSAREWSGSSPSGRGLAIQVLAWLGGHDPSAELEEREGELRARRLHLKGAPMAVAVRPVALSDDVEVTFVTTVPRALAPLSLTRYTWLHTLTTAVRWHVDARLGDTPFDDHFLVDATFGAARAVLTPAVRRQLMKLAHFATPTLSLGAGLARLTFGYTFSPLLLDAAVEVLVTIRNTEPRLALLTPA